MRIGIMAAATLALAATGAEQAQEADVAPAADGVFAAFDEHPLVGLGELHNLSQAFQFYEALIRDPRFAGVGNLVVEFGGAAHQDTIDRYVNGEDVPYEELRRVWTDVVGWQPTVLGAYYPHVFFQVRQTNMALPEDQRIKVWLGEPPIDWTQIHTREDLAPFRQARGGPHPASVIVNNILARGEKALVIYGGAHFERLYPEEKAIYAEWEAADPESARTMIAGWELMKIVQQTHPDAFYTVQMYGGFENAECTADLDRTIAEWATPVLVEGAKDTPLGDALRACMGAFPADRLAAFLASLPASMPPALLDYMTPSPDRTELFEADAILFLAPVAELTHTPIMGDIYLDGEFRAEISRRMEIMSGEPMPADFGRDLPESMAFTGRFR